MANTNNEADAIVLTNIEEKWVNLEDVAEHLSVSNDTIRLWIKSGKLPFNKAGKRYKFKLSEVDAWLREGRISD